MSNAVRTFTLQPHPSTADGVVSRIHGRIARTAEGLSLTYLMEGDLQRLRVPVTSPPRFADELWRHTCVELFVAREGEPGYLEFNFSPSTEWAVYAFASYHERMALSPDRLDGMDPHIQVQRTSDRIEVNAFAAIAKIAPPLAKAALRLGISAVSENIDGTLSYWALQHPSAKPDFHQPDAFVLEFDEIRH